MTSSQAEMTFEAAFHKLETILERMNAADVPLEEALRLFEEANVLMKTCHNRLADAEKRIDVLVKNKQGELTLSSSCEPEIKPLT